MGAGGNELPHSAPVLRGVIPMTRLFIAVSAVPTANSLDKIEFARSDLSVCQESPNALTALSP